MQHLEVATTSFFGDVTILQQTQCAHLRGRLSIAYKILPFILHCGAVHTKYCVKVTGHPTLSVLNQPILLKLLLLQRST